MKRVWSPRAMVWFAILFSIFPAAIMLAINYGRYGQPKKRLLWLVTTVVVLFVVWLLDYFDPEGSKLRLIGLTVLTAWVLYAKQIVLFRKWRSQGGEVATVWSGLGICGVFLVVYITVAFALSFLEPDYLAAELIEKGEFQQAEQVLEQSRRTHPRDLDVRYNLAIVYSETEQKEAAMRELEAILARRPRDQPARKFLRELASDTSRTNSAEPLSPGDAEASAPEK